MRTGSEEKKSIGLHLRARVSHLSVVSPPDIIKHREFKVRFSGPELDYGSNMRSQNGRVNGLKSGSHIVL
jgi:hypothetical protein